MLIDPEQIGKSFAKILAILLLVLFVIIVLLNVI